MERSVFIIKGVLSTLVLEDPNNYWRSIIHQKNGILSYTATKSTKCTMNTSTWEAVVSAWKPVYLSGVLSTTRRHFNQHSICYSKTLLSQRIFPFQRLFPSLHAGSLVVCLQVARWRSIWCTTYHPSSPATQVDLSIIQVDSMAIVEVGQLLDSVIIHYVLEHYV